MYPSRAKWAHVARHMIAHVRSRSHPLTVLRLVPVCSEPVLSALVDNMFAGPRSSLEAGLRLLLALISERARGEEEAPPTAADVTRHKAEVGSVMVVLAPRLARLNTLFALAPGPITTASGRIGAPLGAVRLKVSVVYGWVAVTVAFLLLWEWTRAYPCKMVLVHASVRAMGTVSVRARYRR